MIPDETETIKTFRAFLKNMGVMFSFPTREKYLQRLQVFRNNVNFTWRHDQKHMIDCFLHQDSKYYVLNALFGSGKSTLLIGMHVHALIHSLYRADEAMFLSFNVCIKNELTQKLRAYGMGSKTEVRTFDSIIYEICKAYGYPYMDLPNYEGKRKYVYKICKELLCGEIEEKKLSVSPKCIFIDEVQDLEQQTLIVFQTFFGNAKIVFVGDIFQSVSYTHLTLPTKRIV